MRLFLIEWAVELPELAEVISKIKEKGHSIVYWTRASVVFDIDKSKFPETIFHDHYDAVAAKPAPGVNTDDFPPLSEELIKNLSACESETLTMMNKMCEHMNVNERKHLYYHFLWYWNGVIQKYKPELIIFPMATHALYDFVLYGLAQYYNIPTFMFDVTIIVPYLLTVNDYRVGSPELKNELAKLENKQVTLSDLSPFFRDYYLKHISADADTPPFYLEQVISEYSGTINWLRAKSKMVLRSLKDLSIFKKGVNFIYKKFSSNLRDEYNRLQVAPDFNKKFIFMALHYQPECTTSPQGGIFVDQILSLEILSASLPEGWVIYVKEHPLQWHIHGSRNFTACRYRGYYEHIAKIKNVFIVPWEMSGFRLIRECQIVATITGSSVWEGVLRQKPALYFGYPWYRECPGVFRISDVNSCKDALSRIIKGDAISEQSVIKYLYAFEKASVNGYIDSYHKKLSRLSPQENNENILKALLNEIEKVRNKL